MSQRNTYITGIILTIVAGSLLSYWFCCRAGEPIQEDEVVRQEITRPENPLQILAADGGLYIKTQDNFNFRQSDYNIIRPLSDSITGLIDQLKLYLEGHPESYVVIRGYHAPSEENQSPYPNLGVARANQVKNVFVNRGIKPRQINFYGEQANELVSFEDIYIGPLSISLSATAEFTPEQLDSIAERLKANPLVIHFDTGESSILLSPEERQKLSDMVKYLDAREEGSIRITGHTDNTGTPGGNDTLGMKRATFVRNYFVTHGVPESEIEISSLGQREPIADNNSDEGRAKNRRTVITIQ